MPILGAIHFTPETAQSGANNYQSRFSGCSLRRTLDFMQMNLFCERLSAAIARFRPVSFAGIFVISRLTKHDADEMLRLEFRLSFSVTLGNRNVTIMCHVSQLGNLELALNSSLA